MSGDERAAMVAQNKSVDEVIYPCPWTVTAEFMVEHQIHLVAHDDLPQGASNSDDIQAAVKKAGRFSATARTEGISTTDIIARIIRDYDTYVLRNLKRGVSHTDLNVNYTYTLKL